MTLTPLDPATTALLVMDYQAGIIGRLADADAVVARVSEAIATTRAAGGRVGYVRVALDDEDLATVPAHSSFAAIAGDPDRRAAMHPDSPSTQIDERLAPREHDIVVRKRRVGPFSTTDLREQLGAHGVSTLVLAGLSTSGVVLSAVRQAADLDFRLVVLSDACADTDAEVHAILMSRVLPRQADVVTTAELAGLLGG